MANALSLSRKDLKVGNLYYIHERIKIKNNFSDSIVIWKTGPDLEPEQGHKDIPLSKIWMNAHNPFMLLETREDPDLPSTYWYKIITKDGILGWFAIDDEDMRLLHLSYREAIIPSDND